MYDLLCAQHGGLGHVFVHEAAHAVAAVQRGIAFDEVRILPPDGWISAHDGVMLGGIVTTEAPQLWVQANPVQSMEFVLAGAVSERGAYGHCLDGAYTGDMAVWRIGADLTDADQFERIEALLGRSLASVSSDVERWAVANWPSIRRVAGRLAGVDELSEAVLLEFRDDWRLSHDDVLALVP